jgi:pimeloyl-ACP methyl ester carboxylesterase
MTRGRVLRVLTAVLLIAGALLAAAWGFQRRLVYLPGPSPVPPVHEVLPGATQVRLHTADGLDLDAWFLRARAPGRDATVLVANGNGGNRSLRAPLAAALSEAGFSVLLFDYRGYGGNQGSPSEAGLALDVRAARDFLVENTPTGKLLYFGESLGAAVVTELATEHPPDGMLLRSPFVDLAAVGSVHYPFLPVRTLLRDRYAVARQLSRVTAPTTVVLGTADSVVPAAQSRVVANAAAGPTRVVEVPGAGHNDRALLDGPELIKAVADLVQPT